MCVLCYLADGRVMTKTKNENEENQRMLFVSLQYNHAECSGPPTRGESVAMCNKATPASKCKPLWPIGGLYGTLSCMAGEEFASKFDLVVDMYFNSNCTGKPEIYEYVKGCHDLGIAASRVC